MSISSIQCISNGMSSIRSESIVPVAISLPPSVYLVEGIHLLRLLRQSLPNMSETTVITPAPTFTFDWACEADKLVLFFEAADDTTLIVRNPNGTYQCNDDLDGSANLNPYLDLTPIPGSYQVWLGSYAPDVTVDGTLTITGDTSVRPAP